MGSVTPTTPTTVAYTTKIEYAMDDDGNRTSVVTTPYGSSPATSSYTTNNLNQYTAVGGTSRSHDGNGNVADDGTYTYEYNYKNLICRVKQGSTTVGEYKYDALGRRVEKVVTGATYRYVYSGVETVCVYTSTGTWKQDFVYDAGIDGIVMLQQADVLDQDGDANTTETTRSFYHRNALGSVMEITDMSQHEAVSYRYDPYGQITITRGGTPQSGDPLGQFVTYAGRWRDEETGLHHYRARAYDALGGRFLQRDPLGYAGDELLFEYADSSPVNNCDPMGLEPARSGPENQKKTADARNKRSDERIAGLIPLILAYANPQCREDLALALVLFPIFYISIGDPDHETIGHGGFGRHHGKRCMRIYEAAELIEDLWGLIATICHEAHHAASNIRRGGKPPSTKDGQRESEESAARASGDASREAMKKNTPEEERKKMEKKDEEWREKEKRMRDAERKTGETPSDRPPTTPGEGK